MMKVKFYDTVNDELLKFAVIISQSNGKWVFCKHKERDTYEVPGGHREAGEDIFETAKRELQEETGAIRFEIKPICVYSVTGKNRVNDTGEETFGLLCFAEITEFAKELHSEMEKVVLMDELPENWTYPLIQPKLIEEWNRREKIAGKDGSNMEIKSLLIKDTTKEERIRIVQEGLNQCGGACDFCNGCDNLGGGSVDAFYEPYINGEKELRQLNEEYRSNSGMVK